jgi:hypothetical protein
MSPAVQPRQDARGHWHLDLRGLQPPQPFVHVVRLLSQLGGDAATVHAQFDRDPVMLYPELAERGWQAERANDVGSGVGLVLTRQRVP